MIWICFFSSRIDLRTSRPLESFAVTVVSKSIFFASFSILPWTFAATEAFDLNITVASGLFDCHSILYCPGLISLPPIKRVFEKLTSVEPLCDASADASAGNATREIYTIIIRLLLNIRILSPFRAFFFLFNKHTEYLHEMIHWTRNVESNPSDG